MNHIIPQRPEMVPMDLIDEVTSAPLRPYLDDHDAYPTLQELNINKEGELILQDRRGEKEVVRDFRITESWANDLCAQLAALHGLPYEEGHRTVSTRLTGGHRFTAAIGRETLRSGLAISTRVKRHFKAKPEHFGLLPHQITMLETAIAEGWNIFISGATGTGKTTFLNMLIDWIPLGVRLHTVQDAPELESSHHDLVEWLVPRHENRKGRRLGAAEVMDNLIRMNPDRVLNGELSISNAPYTLFMMNEGHSGMMMTMHANDPLEALEGFKTRMSLGGHGTSGVITQLVRHLDLIVQIENHNGKRLVTHMARPDELPWQMLEGDITTQPDLGRGFLMPKGVPNTPAANIFHFNNYVRAQRRRQIHEEKSLASALGLLDPLERAEYFGNYADNKVA